MASNASRSSDPSSLRSRSTVTVAPSAAEKLFQSRTHSERTVPTTCIETIGGDPNTALRLSFQIKVF